MLLGPIVRRLILFSGIFSLTMLFPLLAAVVFREEIMAAAFGITMAAALALSLPVLIFSKKRKPGFIANEAILLVCIAWITAGLLGAVPYYLAGLALPYSAAVFESVSGFTSTGATIIPNLEILPRSLLLWRGMTQWLGGMGMVVLTAAFVPLLGTGAFHLLKMETTGPMKEKFTPRMTAMIKRLALIYIGLTLSMTALLMLGGMDWLDAAAHACAALGTGGFSTKNAGLAAWNSPYIEWVVMVFMLIAGFNFILIYRLLQGKPGEIARNSEAKAYGLIIIIAAALVAAQLIPHAGSPGKSLRRALFHVVSILSTTGFTLDNPSQWPQQAQFVVLVLMLIGGCSGSAAGGVKIVRYVILFKQTKNELLRNLYPRGVFSIQMDGKNGGKDAVYHIGSFFCLYAAMAALGTLLVSSAGASLYDSLNAALLTVGNIGVGLGKLTSGTVLYAAPGYVKWGLSALMITGRLEIFTVLVLLHPEFWKNNFYTP
jgi:trk system potassium uptake protein TrkH